MTKTKILFWGDQVTPTGFSRVLHSIIKYLDRDEYDINAIGINYYGDPHPYDYKIYPAVGGNDIYGINRIGELMTTIKPDIMFLFNDVWVIDKVLKEIKRVKTVAKLDKLPKIVVYFPVDAEDHDPDWYTNFDIVTRAFVYTEFGLAVASKAAPHIEFSIMPHGVDSSAFFKIDQDKTLLKKAFYPQGNPSFYEDSFIVLSANRNQPRKRLDITLEAFSMFASDKPDNVKLYMHCGVVDSHIDVAKLAVRYGIEKRLILTNLNNGVQQVPIHKLNMIYNVTDVGINTGVGEGLAI